MKTCRSRRCRSGSVLVLALFLMVAMFAMLAFAVDIGYLQVTRSQLQNAADATALAAGWDLIDEDALSGNADPSQTIALARTTASEYTGYNRVGGAPSQLAYEDVEIGYLANPCDPSAVMSFNNPGFFNAVRVRVRRTADQNGGISLFFARVLGMDRANQQAQATAVFLNNICGFRSPPPGEYLGILPFAFKKTAWDVFTDAGGDDNWGANRTWNEETQEWEWEVTSEWDGIPEINLFPQDTGAAGNFGTINIGGNNNSTNVLRRQIELGLTAEDMSCYPDQQLVLDQELGVSLTGDTGISAGMECALRAIVGKPRIVPLYSEVSGVGANATYRIVQFVGVRVVEVDFHGGVNSDKRLVLQPANVFIPEAIRATVSDPMNPTEDEQKSQFIFSPVWLIH
jgi:hypothetical protein